MATKRFEREMIRGWLHEPHEPIAPIAALALTHGASSNCEAPLLKTLAETFCDSGLIVLRFDLPYRQAREHGPPSPAQAARDREGILRVVEALREFKTKQIFLGGHSYGGRQVSMAAAEHPEAADAILLLSYPLHPPGKPAQLRTQHFEKLRTPALFVHGTRDPFGSVDELREAIRSISARTGLMVVEGAPHGVPPVHSKQIALRFAEFTKISQHESAPR